MCIENHHDANGEAIQPYYAAFMIERGYQTLAEASAEYGNQTEYVIWNGDRWREFSRRFGVTPEDRPYHRADFLNWLSDRALDHLARNSVEAA